MYMTINIDRENREDFCPVWEIETGLMMKVKERKIRKTNDGYFQKENRGGKKPRVVYDDSLTCSYS